MAEGHQNGTGTSASLQDMELLARLRTCSTLRTLGPEHLVHFRSAQWVKLAEGEIMHRHDESPSFYLLLEGVIELVKQDPSAGESVLKVRGGDTFGESVLLLRRLPASARGVALSASTLLRVPEDSFWALLATAPGVREAVLQDFSRRFESHQAMTLHREKLISLGTLAAGLMHELNNPGAAASRAASQLRENILRLQTISLRMTRTPLEREELECLAHLQEHALAAQQTPALSSLELSDREEELSNWLEGLNIANASHLAPILVSAGWRREDIECAESSFAREALSDALNYVGALLNSMHQVSTVEESIARVGELVSAVKKYAYDDRQRQQSIDVRDSLLSTLTILGHKFRSKGIRVERELPPERVLISCRGVGLAQVWTNLLDNAADAAPEHDGVVRIRLWTAEQEVCVGVCDNGPGIPPEHQKHIFEAFYTTKPSGVGTGLGLDIVHRIVVDGFRGRLTFTTGPGATEFVVHLPLTANGQDESQGCCVARRPEGN